MPFTLRARLAQLLGNRPVRAPSPRLSLIVVVYKMPEQAERTLLSLSPGYQQGVTAEDYEVIVVENSSSSNLPSELIARLPDNFHYQLRAENQSTPVHAANHGLSAARGEYIALMIDGARMVTPGVVRNLLDGHRLSCDSVVSVPGYHLGRQLQQRAVESGYGCEEEAALLASIDWPNNGYGLFDVACFSGSCAAGLFSAHSESNCLSLPRHFWSKLGGLDTRFDLVGGGLVNLDLYKRACGLPGVAHIVLMGEGTFHQFHGGVTTGGIERARRDALIAAFQAQYTALRGEAFQPPQTSPTYLGQLPEQVMRFVRTSSQQSSFAGQVVEHAVESQPRIRRL
jgi:hypothetical protein